MATLVRIQEGTTAVEADPAGYDSDHVREIGDGVDPATSDAVARASAATRGGRTALEAGRHREAGGARWRGRRHGEGGGAMSHGKGRTMVWEAAWRRGMVRYGLG